MAGNTIDINLSVQDKSGTVKQRTKDAQALNKELEKSQQLATGTRTGSKALRAAYGGVAGGEGTAYGQARGSMGATGASARDFANQAQGLGGLVRLYATYAANVFAVSAAFNALREAMNTTNMVEGLNQLGAASGVAMGNLAKQFAAASGGAISLRESMEATAKAVSSGLSQKQFMQIGEVAKKASQALGVNMSDAVSRLTRGITKLEPELLDELGIFTKVGAATDAYARSVGKSASALTDFERRQAFANAVIEEGLNKFSEIKIDTNPYDKLLATLKNISQTVLEFVNKGLTPLVSLLASSPVALGTLIAGLGLKIIQQALPAIAEYRNSLKASAEDAAKVAASRAEAAKQALAVVRDANSKELIARKAALEDIRVQEIDAAEKRLKEVSRRGLSKKTQQILAPTRDIQSISKEELTYLDTLGSKTTKASAEYRKLAESIRAAQRANQDYAKAVAAAELQRDVAPGRFSAAGIAERRAESARQSAASKSIIGGAGDLAAIYGLSEGFKRLIASIRLEKLGLLRGAFTGIASSAVLAGTAIAGVVSTLSGAIFWVLGIVAGFQALDSWLSSSSEQQSLYKEKLEATEGATKTAIDTAARYAEVNSPEAIQAKAQAFINVKDALLEQVKAFNDLDKAANAWDNTIDWVFDMFGAGRADKLAASTEAAVLASIQAATSPEVRQAAVEKYGEIFGKENLSKGKIKAKIQESGELIGSKMAEAAANAAKDMAPNIIEEAGKVKSVSEGFTQLQTAAENYVKSLKKADPGSDFAEATIQQLSRIQSGLGDTSTRLSTLKDISNNLNTIKFLPDSVQFTLTTAAANLGKLEQQAVKASLAIAQAQDKLKAAKDLSMAGLPGQALTLRIEGTRELQAATDEYNKTVSQIASWDKRVAISIRTAMLDSIEKIEAPVTAAIAKGAVAAQQTILGYLPKSEATAKIAMDLEIQSLAIQRKEIEATQALTIQLEKNRLSSEKSDQEKKLESTTATSEQKAKAAKRIGQIDLEMQALTDPEKLKKQLGTMENIPAGVAEMLKLTAATRAQLASVDAAMSSARIKGALEQIAGRFETQITTRRQELEKERNAFQEFLASAEYASMPAEQKDYTRKMREAELDRLQSQIDLLGQQRTREQLSAAQKLAGPGTTLGTASAQALELANRDYAIAEERSKIAYKTATTQAEEAKTTETLVKALEDRNNVAAAAAVIERDTLDARKTQLETESQLLEAKNKLGYIGTEEYNRQTFILKGKEAELSWETQLADIRVQSREKLFELDKKLAQLGPEGRRDPAEYDRLVKERSETEAHYLRLAANANVAYQGIKQANDMDQDFTGRTKAYGDIFKNTFEGMSDAIIDFVKTGKLNFSDLIDSMISDIIRFEMRKITMSMYESSGISGFLGNMFTSMIPGMGGGSPSGGSIYSLSGAGSGGLGLKMASGGAFNTGIQEFAKGGTFTNSIVTSPTLFKFAKGTGLMGEAGPEAIMPLARDSSGTLGVRAQTAAPNVDVVVNNYSGEKAETKESVDSRGNRKIEVIIGEMVAAETQRPNSAMQNTMRSTFGVAPMLTRR